MPFARAPVQPVNGCLPEVQALGEGFYLLPFAPRYIHLQALGGRWQDLRGQAFDAAEGKGSGCQLRERRGSRQIQERVVTVFGVLQRTTAQPSGEFRVLRFPRHIQRSEGPWAPEVLVVMQKPVQRRKAGEQVSGLGRHRRAASAPAA